MKLKLTVLILLITKQLFPQELKEIKKTHRIDSISYYNWIYSSYNINKVEYKEGNFEFYYNKDSSVVNNKNGSLIFCTAQFSKNILNGKYKYGKLNYTEQIDDEIIIDFKKSLPLFGNLRQTSGSFKDGKPTGKWNYFDGYYINNQLRDSVEYATFSFESGNLNGKFEMISLKDSIHLILNVENGILNGKTIWKSIRHNSDFVEYDFKNGVLEKIAFNGQKIYENSIEENLESFKLSIDFLNYVETETFRSEYSQKISKSTMYLINIINKVFPDAINHAELVNMSLSSYIPEIKLKTFPYSEIEKKQVAELLTNILQLQNDIDSLLNKKSLVGAKSKAIELEKIYTEITILKDITNQFAITLNLLNSQAYKYFNKEHYVKKYFFQSNQNYEKNFEFNNSVIQTQISLKKIEEINWLDALKARSEELIEIKLDFEQRIFSKLSNLIYEKELLDLQSEIYEVSKIISENLDDASIFIFNNQLTESYKQAFNNQKDRLLNKFANEEKEDKLGLARQTLECLVEIQKLLFTTSDLEKKSDIIHISFHVQEFNPYTNTEITVVLHQRLFNAYKDKIFPFIIEDLLKHSSSIDCYTFSKKHNNIIELQEFMLTTTEEKLREINKKLRNKDDVKTILEKTGLTFN